MGIYETLYAFQKAFGTPMGESGTHPWSQGYPLTTQIPGGPAMPKSVDVDSADLLYPKLGVYQHCAMKLLNIIIIIMRLELI